MSQNRPIWRWWLFCVALDLWFRFRWEWAREVFGWCVLPEWLGYEAGVRDVVKGEAPF